MKETQEKLLVESKIYSVSNDWFPIVKCPCGSLSRSRIRKTLPAACPQCKADLSSHYPEIIVNPDVRAHYCAERTQNAA